MKKLRNPILSKSNVKRLDWKKKNYTKGLKIKKIIIRRIKIKIKIKNKLENNYKFSIEEWNQEEK